MKKKGLLVVVSGPSGAGKSTVLGHTFSKSANLKYSISVTTREPREGEKDGVNYYFKTKEEFEKMRQNDEFLEYKTVYGNFYGTPKAYVEQQLAAGCDVVLEIDTQGALEVKNQYPDCVMIFVTPTECSTIEERLRKRSTESEEQLKIRLKSSLEEIKMAVLYDYIVINEDAQESANDIVAIVAAHKCKFKYNKKIIDNLILGGKKI